MFLPPRERPWSASGQSPSAKPLGFDPITSTLIFGEHDAVLVDAMGTVAEAEALADWVALHNRNLETIYITHAHFDHFYGLSILLDRFPAARAIATPKTVNAMQSSFTPAVERLARRMFPGQVPTKLVPPEPYEGDTFTLEGHELRIIEQGRTDSPDSTSLYVPSIGLIVAGDVVYNQCRMYVGDTTPESRQNWIAALDRLAALNPAMVVAGHKKPGAPDSPSTIQDTKRYLQDFDRCAENRDVRPGAVRSDDGAVPALGSQSVVVDVRIPAAITHINRVGRPCALWETVRNVGPFQGVSTQVSVPISERRNTMATKGKILVLVSSGRGLPLKDGKVYTGAGYYLNELTVPVRALMKEGYEITFANPKGNTPQVDVHSAVADFFGGDEAKLQDYMLFRDSLTGLRDPTRISDVIASGLDQYDAVFVPGGHGPMIDLLDDPNAGIVMRHFHETSKPTAVLCHGPISLLSALPEFDRSLSRRWRRAIPLERTQRLKAGSMPDIR